MIKRRQFIGLTALFLASCTGATVSEPAANSSSATAESVELPEVIRLAVTDEFGLEPLEANFSEFREALAEALGTEVEFVPVDDQISGALLLKEGKIDLALAGPSEYVVINARTNAVPVIAITRPNYRSVLATKVDSEVKTIADLKGKTVALSGVGSTSGHLGPITILIDAGLDPQADLEVQMLGDEGSIEAITTNAVDVWGGSFADYEELAAENPETFTLLEEGPLLPSDVFMASSQVSPEIIEVIKAKMLENEDSLTAAIATHERKYEGSTLKPAADSDYDSIRDAYKAIGQGDFLE
jgi:phosphonate transport system substrate-binding protein